MEAYSQDLRDRVLRALERGERPVDIAQRLEVSRIWVYQVKSRFKTSGERCSRPIGGHRISRLAPAEQEVRAWIKKQPDLTLAELGERLSKEKGIQLKIPALWHQLNKWGLSFKKNSARQRAGAGRRALGQRPVARKTKRPKPPTTCFS